MCSELALEAHDLGKCYRIYPNPRDRLKQAIWPGSRRFYEEFWALRHLDLEIPRGQTLGIIGRNGSGKSTLLQLLCGTLEPTEGSVKTHGRIAALLELGAGFNPEFSGRENVFLNASILGLTRPQIEARFDDIAAFADLGAFLNRPVKTYSSGMFVRLAFAVIAHVDADILVVDEALAVGDVLFSQKCVRFLNAFREKGTILFVSHDTGMVLNLCQNALWLEAGHQKARGSAKTVCDLYIENLFPGRGAPQISPTSPPVASEAKDSAPSPAPVHAASQIEVFEFNPQHSGAGSGGAQIQNLCLLNTQGDVMSWIQGGESVRLEVHCQALQDLQRPIVGFYLRDRLGQNLLGENTFLTYRHVPLAVMAGQKFKAAFVFTMPFLPAGEYTFSAGLAEGTQESHIQHHWLQDILVLRSHCPRTVNGLVGIPMDRIELQIQTSREMASPSSTSPRSIG